MAVTWRNLKKWAKMITGRSLVHVHQNVGRFYSKDRIRGYYNDLREKVTRDSVPPGSLPRDPETGGEIHCPTIIIQYGLGCYDCYLETNDPTFLQSFWACADWTVARMASDGAIPWTSDLARETPYSAMSQGEATSLLLRAFAESGNEKYLHSAQRACSFMQNETVIFRDGLPLYQEFIGKPIVFNGMVFAIFGIYDLWLATKSESVLIDWQKAVDSLEKITPDYDSGRWVYYDEGKKYTSKFYLNLHVALLEAMYDLTGREVFNTHAIRWRKFLKNPFRRWLYFWRKAWQKIKEK